MAHPSETAESKDHALALFRAGIALSVAAKHIAAYSIVDLLYGRYGVIQPPIAEAFARPDIPTAFSISRWLTGHGIDWPVYQTLYFVCLVAALGLFLGAFCRLSALICWVSNGVLMNSANVFIYGVDDLQHIGLFYCIVFPVARAYSIDAARLRKGQDPWLSDLAVFILRVHVCLIYLSAGYSKIVGEQWWTGEAIWRAFLQPRLIHFPFTLFDLATLAAYEPLFRIAGLTVVTLQLGFPVLVFLEPLRRYVLAAMILLHGGIVLFLGLYLFSLLSG